jgi:hypothetical protein
VLWCAAEVVLQGRRDARPERLDHVQDAKSGRRARGGGRRAAEGVAGVTEGTGHDGL